MQNVALRLWSSTFRTSPSPSLYTWMQINELPDVTLNLKREKLDYNITQNWNPFMITQPKSRFRAHSFVRGKTLCPSTTLTQNERVVEGWRDPIRFPWWNTSFTVRPWLLKPPEFIYAQRKIDFKSEVGLPPNLFNSNWTRNELLEDLPYMRSFFAFIYFCSLFAKRYAKNKPFKQKSNLSNEKIGAFAAAQQNKTDVYLHWYVPFDSP